MDFEAALATADAHVRSHALPRDAARHLGDSSVYAVATPLSPPRLWSWVANAALEAFERSMAGTAPTPSSLNDGIVSAARAIERVRAQLIEPRLLLDARFGSLLADRGSVHVTLTEGVRLYRARGGMPERLFHSAQRPAGIGAGPCFAASERVEPGDVLFFGTREAFSVRSIGNLAGALSKNARATVSELCESLVGPARDGGEGAAAVVLRVR